MNTPYQISSNEAKALQIIKEHGPIRPREFARLMWPNSEGWNHHIKCGPNGSHKGGGMYLAAGGYLGRLSLKFWLKKDWHHPERGYLITKEGTKMLEEYEMRRLA